MGCSFVKLAISQDLRKILATGSSSPTLILDCYINLKQHQLEFTLY